MYYLFVTDDHVVKNYACSPSLYVILDSVQPSGIVHYPQSSLQDSERLFHIFPHELLFFSKITFVHSMGNRYCFHKVAVWGVDAVC